MNRVHRGSQYREQSLLDLDELARQGARRMLAEVLEAEVAEYIEAARGQRDENGYALVVRNGHAPERQVVCGAGSVEVKAPRVNERRMDENGERQRFKSVILPPYMRRSQKVTEVLPRICTAFPTGTSCRLWRSSSLPRPGYPPRRSPSLSRSAICLLRADWTMCSLFAAPEVQLFGEDHEVP